MLRVFVEKHEKTHCPMCKPMNLQRTFRCKNLPRAAALLQHRQVNLHARKIHVFLLANGDVIHDLAKERYHMLSFQTWIWTAKSETHGHFSKFRNHGAIWVPLFTIVFLIFPPCVAQTSTLRISCCRIYMIREIAENT